VTFRPTSRACDVATAPEPILAAIAEVLSRRYDVPYDGVWLNLYRDEHDSTGWHGDWATCKRDHCFVPVLSLGATPEATSS
jgi:alkylated DNA repair dioxygenase AlkB